MEQFSERVNQAPARLTIENSGRLVRHRVGMAWITLARLLPLAAADREEEGHDH